MRRRTNGKACWRSCATVVTQQTLRAGAAFSQSYSIKAGTAPDGQFVVLPPGEYVIRARLEDTIYKVESDPVSFALQ